MTSGFAALLAAVSIQAAYAPVTIVVTAHHADRADAARLQSLVDNAVNRIHVADPRFVTVEYYGRANAVVLPPREVLGARNQLVFAAFTITNRDGNVLWSEWLLYPAMQDHLTALHEVADTIAARLRTSSR